MMIENIPSILVKGKEILKAIKKVNKPYRNEQAYPRINLLRRLTNT